MESKFYELILPQEKIPYIKTSDAIIGGKGGNFDIQEYGGNYVVILFLSGASHSISEHTLSKFSEMTAEFENVGCKLLAITKASIFTAEMWLQTMEAAENTMPIVCDQKEEFIRPFGVLHNDNRLGHPANTVVIVDRKWKVRYLSILEPTVEHSPAEILELVEQFQSTDDGHHVVMADNKIIENTIPAMKEYFKTYVQTNSSMLPSLKRQDEIPVSVETGSTTGSKSVYSKGSRARSVAATSSRVSPAPSAMNGSTASDSASTMSTVTNVVTQALANLPMYQLFARKAA